MAHEVKRSKNSNNKCPSDLSTSLTSDHCSLGAGCNDNKTRICVLGFSLGEKVFGIDWIREEILNYVIYNNQQKVSTSQIKIMRLVRKSWLSTVTRLLKKCEGPPPIQLTLDNISSYDVDPAENLKENKKKLEQFIAKFGDSTRLKESFLPFKLKLDSDFIRYENFPKLSDCFTRFGNELLELEIVYPYDGGNMPVYFRSLNFPILQKLSFQFSRNFHIDRGNDIYNFEDNRFGLWLLQSILNAGKNLQELNLPFDDENDDSGDGNEDLVPATFEYLQLPLSIVSLKLELEFTSKTVETLSARNELPNLTHLTVKLHNESYQNGLMYKILERVRKTLVSLNVSGQRSSISDRLHNPTRFRFPQMEKLECINIECSACDLGPSKQFTYLQESVPKLNRVHLGHQSEDMLLKMMKNSTFERVHKLGVMVIDEDLSGEDNNYVRSPSMGTTTRLSEVFPNVQDLTLQLNIGFLNVLECLFMKMGKLERLELQFSGRIQTSSSNLLDSKLTGVPIGLVGALKENSVDTLQTTLVVRNEGQSSIRNLTELTTLTLCFESKAEDDQQISLSSDFLFGQAFMKMSKLRNLYLHGKFQPSISMHKEWRDQGRFINYSA